MSEKKIGSSVYKEKAKVLKKTNELPNFFPPLPEKKYDIIYADPPWHYNGKMQFDRSGKSVDQIDLSKNIFISAAKFDKIRISLRTHSSQQKEVLTHLGCGSISANEEAMQHPNETK